MKPLAFVCATTAQTRLERLHNVLHISPLTKNAPRSPTALAMMMVTDDVLGTQDIVVGAGLAVLLALLASFLQGRRNNPDVILWKEDEEFDPSKNDDEEGVVVFGAENWKDMSREENYVLYNTKVRKRLEKKKESSSTTTIRTTEKRYVVLALLVLFVPIFSFEFFLSLSRQLICGGGGDPSEWAQSLCAPHFEP